MINNFVIFGDSYSTHKNFIPEGFVHYYCDEGRNPQEPVTKMLWNETWWGRFMARTGANLVRNDSWSGSTICYTGRNGDCSRTSSFIYRHRKLLSEGFFEKNKIDTIFVFGGTNDSWIDAPLGEEMYSDWQESDLFNVLPAICHLVLSLRENHPDAKIIVVGNCNVKAEILACMKNVSAHVGADFVALHDIEKVAGHPNSRGMEQICDQILEQIEG